MGIRPRASTVTSVVPELQEAANRAARLASEMTYKFKVMSKKLDVKMLDRQAVQARFGLAAIMLHAWMCTLSRLDSQLRQHAGNGQGDLEFQRDKTAALHFFDLAELEILAHLRELDEHADPSMLAAAEAAIKHNDTLPASDFIIPERTPTAMRGQGRSPRQEGIKQFPGDRASQFAQAPKA
jgi:hypothetical protein